MSMTGAAVSTPQGCDQEPIHLSGRIQPHGVLLVLDAALNVIQCSANTETQLGLAVPECLASSLESIVGPDPARLVRVALEQDRPSPNPLFLGTIPVRDSWFDLFVHENSDLIIVELEKADHLAAAPGSSVFRMLSKSIGSLQQQTSLTELCDSAAREIRALIDFDRVLIYRFGPDWAGTVIAESRTGQLPSYLDLRFPESDIPRQARELYRLNRIRLIADADAIPVPLLPVRNQITGAPADLTYSALRSVSPVHIEYMKNMGTHASMSISIVRHGRLWGLVACHHHAPAHISAEVRFACELLTQILSSQIVAVLERASNERRSELQASQHLFLTRISEVDSIVEAVKVSHDAMLRCVGSEGAAVLFDGQCELLGSTPSESQVRELAAWIADQPEHDLFATDELSRLFPPSDRYRDVASGVVAASISEFGIGYLLWFRPEQSTKVKWAGDPNEIKVAVDGRIHPRKSFETWTKLEKGRSHPWDAAEIESATFLRSAIINLVLRKAQKLAALSTSLQQSNSELEAFSYSVSHDLRAPFRHIVGYAEILSEAGVIEGENRRYLETIIESANFAGLLVDNLLSFARIGRSKLSISAVPMKLLVEDIVRVVTMDEPTRAIRWVINDLPEIPSDLFLIRLVLENLIRNAVKYTRRSKAPEIEIGSLPESASDHIIFVKDNGVGFDMQYAGKLFGVFQRLHRVEDFEGTGIGLATVRRIIGRHHGRVWAISEVDRGATFFFSLPRVHLAQE